MIMMKFTTSHLFVLIYKYTLQTQEQCLQESRFLPVVLFHFSCRISNIYFSTGAIFLFTYSLGYATPVVAAGALSSSTIGALFKSGGAEWANTLFASLLIFYGTYTAFDNVAKIFSL